MFSVPIMDKWITNHGVRILYSQLFTKKGVLSEAQTTAIRTQQRDGSWNAPEGHDSLAHRLGQLVFLIRTCIVLHSSKDEKDCYNYTSWSTETSEEMVRAQLLPASKSGDSSSSRLETSIITTYNYCWGRSCDGFGCYLWPARTHLLVLVLGSGPLRRGTGGAHGDRGT
jgi:hypothetical protein